MSIETPPQPRFRMWDRVRYRYSAQPVLYTVIAICWDSYADDYEYKLMSQDQSLDEPEDNYSYAGDRHDAWYLVCRPGTTCLYQRPDGTPTTEAEGNMPLPPSEERVIADRKQHINAINAERPDPRIETLKTDVRRLRELFQKIGTLCASPKEGD